MVEEIYALKNKILEHVEKKTMNMDRIDVKEIGELVDMVKDLAEAEKECWEASYYRKVTEAMEEGKSGYTATGGSGGGGGSQSGGGGGGRSGYGSMRQGYGSSGGGGSMGHSELIEKLGEEYDRMSPDEQMMMKNKILMKLGR